MNYITKFEFGITTLQVSNKPVTLWTRASSLVIFGTINIGTVVERSIAFPHRTPATLVQIVPVEACKWPMVCTPTLKKIWTLLCAKLFQVSVHNINRYQYNMYNDKYKTKQ